MTAVLETRRLGKRYGRRWALSDCTLDIPAGRVVGLVGPNGAGKSTLLNLMLPDVGVSWPAARLNPGWDAAVACDRAFLDLQIVQYEVWGIARELEMPLPDTLALEGVIGECRER